MIMQQAIARSGLSKHKSRHPPPVGLLNSAKQHTDHKRKHSECFQERSPLLQQSEMVVATSSWTKMFAVHPPPAPFRVGAWQDVNSAGAGRGRQVSAVRAGRCLSAHPSPQCSPGVPWAPHTTLAPLPAPVPSASRGRL